MVIHGFYDSGHRVDTKIAPDKAVRYFAWERTRLQLGPCELAYDVPDLPTTSGSVLPFEIWPNGKLYLQAPKDGEDLKDYGRDGQPPGWPLAPTKTGCP